MSLNVPLCKKNTDLGIATLGTSLPSPADLRLNPDDKG